MTPTRKPASHKLCQSLGLVRPRWHDTLKHELRTAQRDGPATSDQRPAQNKPVDRRLAINRPAINVAPPNEPLVERYQETSDD